MLFGEIRRALVRRPMKKAGTGCARFETGWKLTSGPALHGPTRTGNARGRGILRGSRCQPGRWASRSRSGVSLEWSRGAGGPPCSATRRETTEELVLRDELQNQEVRLRRATIQEKRQNGSVMPAGLADTLTREEFRDLVRYLSELGRAKPEPN